MNRTADPHCGRFEPIADRRQFLQRAGAGLGMLALADLLGDPRVPGGRRTGRPARPEADALPRQGEVGHLAVHGGGPERGRPVRPQAGARPPGRQADRDRRLQRQPRPADEVAVPVPPARPERGLGLREVPGRRQARGRHRVHQVLLHRVEQPRAGAVPDQHRHPPARLPVRRGLGHVRPREREPEPARLRGPGQQSGGQGRAAQLGRRVPADDLPGDALPLGGEPGPQPQPPGGGRRGRPAGAARPDGQAERRAPPRPRRRGRPAGPDPELRAGLPDADGGDRPGRPRRRDRPRRATSYGLDDPESRSFGSKCLLARRLVERGVRFVQVYSDGEWDAHADLPSNHTEHCAATDVPIDGLLTDLKRRGLLRLDAGHLGRRVRPDAGLAGEQRPRPQPPRLPRLDGRRGHQGGRQLTARPTRSATRPRSTRCRSTTCTPRCSTCWASTTSG